MTGPSSSTYYNRKQKKESESDSLHIHNNNNKENIKTALGKYAAASPLLWSNNSPWEESSNNNKTTVVLPPSKRDLKLDNAERARPRPARKNHPQQNHRKTIVSSSDQKYSNMERAASAANDQFDLESSSSWFTEFNDKENNGNTINDVSLKEVEQQQDEWGSSNFIPFANSSFPLFTDAAATTTTNSTTYTNNSFFFADFSQTKNTFPCQDSAQPNTATTACIAPSLFPPKRDAPKKKNSLFSTCGDSNDFNTSESHYMSELSINHHTIRGRTSSDASSDWSETSPTFFFDDDKDNNKVKESLFSVPQDTTAFASVKRKSIVCKSTSSSSKPKTSTMLFIEPMFDAYPQTSTKIPSLFPSSRDTSRRNINNNGTNALTTIKGRSNSISSLSSLSSNESSPCNEPPPIHNISIFGSKNNEEDPFDDLDDDANKIKESWPSFFLPQDTTPLKRKSILCMSTTTSTRSHGTIISSSSIKSLFSEPMPIFDAHQQTSAKMPSLFPSSRDTSKRNHNNNNNINSSTNELTNSKSRSDSISSLSSLSCNESSPCNNEPFPMHGSISNSEEEDPTTTQVICQQRQYEIALRSYYVGREYFSMGRLDDAMDALKESMQHFATFTNNSNTGSVMLPIAASCLFGIASVQLEKKDYSMAVKGYEEMLKIATSSADRAYFNQDYAEACHRLGLLYYAQYQEYDKSLFYMEQALHVNRFLWKQQQQQSASSSSSPPPSVIGIILNNTGNVYHKLGALSQALSFYYRALRIWSKGGRDCIMTYSVSTWSNIGVIHTEESKYDKSLEAFKNVLKILSHRIGTSSSGTDTTSNHNCYRGGGGEILPDKVAMAKTYTSIGYVHSRLGESDNTLSSFKAALSMYKSLFGENHFTVAIALERIGNVYETKGHLTTALSTYKEIWQILQLHYKLSDDHPSVVRILKSIVRILDLEDMKDSTT